MFLIGFNLFRQGFVALRMYVSALIFLNFFVLQLHLKPYGILLQINHRILEMSQFSPPLIGAIDQGTQSSRFLVFDSKASVVASHRKSHKQIIPQPGWCEHDPVSNLVLLLQSAHRSRF